MKHLLNNLTEQEKNAIREQHTGGMKVMTENFSKLTNSKLGNVAPLLKEQDNGTGFGLKNSKGEMREDDSVATPSSGTDNSFVSFLKQQGFRDFSGGQSYGMNFHYISRKPGTPANLTMVLGQDKGGNTNTCDIDILFDSKIEHAERYRSISEFNAKSAIPKIEKLLNTEFQMRGDEKLGNESFNLTAKSVPLDKAKQAVILYNQIKLKGPYGGV